MVDQAPAPTPASPAGSSRPSSVGLPLDGRSVINDGRGMFGPAPDRPVKTPSADEMQRAGMSPDQRYRADVAGSDALARSYDKPVEAPRPGELPRQDAVPEPAGEKRYTVGEGRDAVLLTYDEARGIMAKMAEESIIKNTIKSPADLRAEPTSDFKPPPGFEYKIDPNNPLARAAQEWAFEAGIGQQRFSQLVDIFATQQVSQAQQIAQARDREAKELGPAVAERVDANLTWLRAMIGDDLAGALGATMFTAKSVMAIEALSAKFMGYNGSRIGAGRSHEPRGIPDEVWAKMNWNEKRQHQIEHQAQQQARGRR